MIDLAVLVVLAFAAYRLTVLAVDDEPSRPFRERIGAWHAVKQNRLTWAIDYLVNCPYCIGWWLSGSTLALFHAATSWPVADTWVAAAALFIIEWFAVAGAAVVLYRFDDSLDGGE